MENLKIRLTEDELIEVIKETLNMLGFKKEYMLEADVLRGFLNNAIISEGLVKTFSFNDVRKVLMNIGVVKYGIKIGMLPFFKYANSKGEKPLQITLTFNNGLNGIDEHFFHELFHKMDVLGWYFASVLGHGKSFDYYQLKALDEPFTCVFEPKFDVLLSDNDMPNILYHITPTRLVKKMKDKGIVPKSGSMYTNHPERVYLFLDFPEKELNSIKDSFNNGKGINESFSILYIDYGRIRDGNKFYIDPNSNKINACFTLEPIPPFAIIKDEEI